MRIFTLGKNGIPLFFFALFLFSGTYTYGQNCPTVVDEDAEESGNQQFYCYLQTVADLQATGNGDGVLWYRTATSTNPIPEEELLRTGNYYAGNNTGNCSSRPVVTVTVETLEAPTSEFGNFFEPCEYSAEDVTTAGDLKQLITPSDPSFDINVYSEEFGTADSELADSYVLVEGQSYYIGQTDPESDCSFSYRIAVQYNPVNAFAPDAPSIQQFCESDNPTVADLTATATSPNTQAFRWYSTEDSNPPLAASTPLVDGETYFVSQIVNRTNSSLPPCESTQRDMVTVRVIPSDAGEDNTDNVLCVSEADSSLNNLSNARTYFIGLLESGVPTDGTFADETLEGIVADYTDGTKTGTYQTTYTATFEEGCQDSVILAVRVEEDPYAGEDTEAELCVSEIQPLISLAQANPDLVRSAFRDYIAGTTEIDEYGTFEPSLETVLEEISTDITNENLPQTYELDYVVNNNGCENRSTLSLTIAPEVNAGTTNSAELCETEVEEQGIFVDENSLRDYYLNLIQAEDTNGTFDPSLSTLISSYNNGITSPSEDFTTEYTVDNGVCEASSATATLTVNAAEPGEAGTIVVPTLCSTDSEINLYDYLGTNSHNGGTFSSDEADVSEGTFNPSTAGAGTFSISYTVREEDETTCLNSTDTAVFSVTVDQAPDAGTSNSETLCETAVEEEGIFADEDNLRSYFLSLLNAQDTDGSFSPSLDTLLENYNDGIEGSEDFEVTYTVDNSDVCEPATATASLTVNEAIEAEAGTPDEDIVYCSNDTAVALADLLTGANPDGLFTSEDADVSGGTFNPSVEGAGTYEITYTVSPETACVTNTATVTFSIRVNAAPNAGPGGDFAFCQAEFEAIVGQIAANPEGQGIELLEEIDVSITTGGEFTNSSLSQLLAAYAEATSFPATFTTTYTVSNDDCTDSATYSITINPNEEANAGGNQTANFCTSEGLIDLNTTLGDEALAGGTFTSSDLTIIDGNTFDTTVLEAGSYQVVYTVNSDSNPCVTGSDSATITITIDEIFNLEDMASDVVCTNDVSDDFFTEENLRTTFLSLLPANAPQDGTFSPSLSDLAEAYDEGMTSGDFSTNYTITTDQCEESILLTLTLRENIEAELSEVENPEPICQNAGIQDLYSFIGDNPDSGTFEGYENGNFDPGIMEAGTYNITYTMSENTSECVSGTASITFSITVLDSAFAGDDREIEFCANDGVQDLYTFLSTNADADGSFTLDGTEINDGTFDPATLEVGTYSITYTVPAENDCGEDTASLDVTISASPAAPTVTDFSGCAVDGSTVADLDITVEEGNSFAVYTDAELNTPAADTDALTEGTYYVTQINATGCESEAAEVSVTLTDSEAPTISLNGNVFCTSDNATIADLEERVSANGLITWYATETGTEALTAATVLQDQTTYYAASTSADSACESSQRLSVTVRLERCEIVIPDAFSPNGDQMNDYFTIDRISSEYPNHNLQIYNRWGEMVFNGKGANPGWDGTSSEGSFGSGVLPAGVYFYILYFNDGQTAPTQGRLYLSR